jgi:thioredoxin 2
VDAGDASFAEVVEQASVPVLVDFWAPWCGPCRMVSPVLAQLAGEKPGQVKLVKINVDEAPQLGQRFGVQAIPTLMVFRDGQLVSRQTGAAPAPALRSWLDQSLTRPATPAAGR